MDTISKLIEDSGIEVVDDAAIRRKAELDKASSYITMSKESNEALRDRAVKLGLVPPPYRNAEFDQDKIQENITKQQNASGHKFKVIRSSDYFDIANSIISTIRANKIPDKSYIIGAPNGFGKQSFATDCILASLRNGWITVPYISLLELGELKTANDRVIERGLMGMETEIAHQPFNFNTGKFDTEPEIVEKYYYAMGDRYTDIKSPTIITGQYSWSEYINAPVLICFFSGIESKLVESQTLYTLLNIRSAKGYPTIATISTSLDIYLKDPVIGRYVWKEIMSYDDDSHDLNRVTHISTAKVYKLKP